MIGGTAEVSAPTEKIERARVELPEVTFLDRETRYQHLLSRTKDMPQAVAPVRAGRGADEGIIAYRRADG